MGYRRSRRRIAAAQAWASFVSRNAQVIREAGLPEPVVESIAHWDEFLLHGRLDWHPDLTGFSVDRLSEVQYRALTQLVDSYFATGYEYFTPLALRPGEREGLDARYGPGAI